MMCCITQLLAMPAYQPSTPKMQLWSASQPPSLVYPKFSFNQLLKCVPDVQEAAGKLRQQLQITTTNLDARTKAVDECEARIRRLTAEVAALTREVTAKDAEILALQHRCDLCQVSLETQLSIILRVVPSKLG